MNLSADTFLRAVVCYAAPGHRVFVRCEPGRECFRLSREKLLRQFGKEAPDAATDLTLVGKRAGTAEVVAELVLEVVAANLLCSPPNGLPMHHSLSSGLLACVNLAVRGACSHVLDASGALLGQTVLLRNNGGGRRAAEHSECILLRSDVPVVENLVL